MYLLRHSICIHKHNTKIITSCRVPLRQQPSLSWALLCKVKIINCNKLSCDDNNYKKITNQLQVNSSIYKILQYIYIYIYIHTYTHTHIYVYIYIYIYYMCACALMHVCVYIHMHACMHTHTYIYICACVHAHVHACTHACTRGHVTVTHLGHCLMEE